MYRSGAGALDVETFVVGVTLEVLNGALTLGVEELLGEGGLTTVDEERLGVDDACRVSEGDDAGATVGVINPVDWLEATDEVSPPSRSNSCLFFDFLEAELGALLLALGSSYTSTGHIKKNINTLTGDITSKAAAADWLLVPGRRRLGPKSVARLFSVILLVSDSAATL